VLDKVCVFDDSTSIFAESNAYALVNSRQKRSQGTHLLVEEYKEKLGYYCDFEDTLIRSNPKLTR
jgi:hypothetical protein